MNESFSNHIQLFKSVFKGREDVFAIRWEKGNKSGYMPAYHYDPYMYPPWFVSSRTTSAQVKKYLSE
jgi:hypothetical protein